MKAFHCARVERIGRAYVLIVIALSLACMLVVGLRGSRASQGGDVGAAQAVKSTPKWDVPSTRPPVPDDFAYPLVKLPGIFVCDVVVNNTNPALQNTDTAPDGETSIAVNPANPEEIVISAFSGGWGANAPIYHSLNGGITWTRQNTVPVPPGWPTGCPCDWNWDYGRNNQLTGTILANSPTVAMGVDVVTTTTTNPAMAGQFMYFDPPGPPTQAQETNILVPNSLGNTDQPWVLVNPDPITPAQDNVYVAWDDFNDTDGTDGPDLNVSVSYGVNPPNFTVNQQVGNALGGGNPGLRLARDDRTGYMWALYGRNVGAGAGGSKNIDFMLNRTTDGGASWSLNGNAFGIMVANADSTQPWPKFGTVNALIGGVHHAGVDPVTGDLYYVYGNRDAGTGNDRLAIRKVSSDGAGGVVVGAEHFVTGQVEAAIPQVAVTESGIVGVFYYSFDGFSSDDFPVFTAHIATSDDEGASFTDHSILTFLSSAMDACAPGFDCDANPTAACCGQRVLGDYVQMKAVGNTFYGSFTANGVAFGRTMANEDPIFFRATVGPRIQVPPVILFPDTCRNDPISASTETLEVCNTGSDPLVIQSITSTNTQFTVQEPSGGGFPVFIAPDECFPFQVVFTPFEDTLITAGLIITSNDPASPQVAVTARGVGTSPEITTVITDGGDFGNVCVDDHRDLDVIIGNDSSACDLSVSDITSNSAQFVVADVMVFPLVVAPGDSVAVPIRFEPSGAFGVRNATLTITSDDPGITTNVSVSGNVPPGDVVVKGVLDFGEVCPEDVAEIPVSICNVGLCTLNVIDVSTNCREFTIVSNPFPNPVSHDFCLDVVIRFTPTSSGVKICQLTVQTDDPDNPVRMFELTGVSIAPTLDIPPFLAFPPTVTQSTGPCVTELPFPISNNGVCNVTVTDISIVGGLSTVGASSASAGNAPMPVQSYVFLGVEPEFSLVGLPSFPIVLEPGHVVGSGDLRIAFAPESISRARTGLVSITYVTDPAAGTEMTVNRMLCGEGVLTGARVLVTHGGVPVDEVKRIKLRRINANQNGDQVDTVDVAMNLPLVSVSPPLPCPPFQYHREYGTVSNPIQLLPGSFLVDVDVRINNHMESKTVAFDVSTCDFNPSVVVNFD